MGFRFWSLRCGVGISEFRVWGGVEIIWVWGLSLGCWVKFFGLAVDGLGFTVQGSESEQGPL